MNQNRRTMLKASSGLTVLGLAVAAGLIKPNEVFAAAGYPEKAFNAKSMDELMKALGSNMPTESADITVVAPDIAENGAVVPIGASTTLAGVKHLLLLVEKNPSTLCATFDVTPDVEANFLTRVKMGQSSDIYAVAIMNDGKALFAKKETKVTLGGCGG